MRISELGRRAGVPLSAVKYYQREGLLPAGKRSAPNQVDYGDEHVQRVRLVRALLETGRLTVTATKHVIQILDESSSPLPEAFRIAQHAMTGPRALDQAPSDESRQCVIRLAHSHGWHVSADNPGVDVAARALDGLLLIGFRPSDSYLSAYATAAKQAAHADLDALSTLGSRDAVTELMVVGTVLGDPLFAGLRRLAQQDASQAVFPASN